MSRLEENVDLSDYTTWIEPIRYRMINAIWRVVRDADETEDVLQDVLLKIMKHVKTLRRHPNPTAWILRICINSALDRSGRNRRAHAAASVTNIASIPSSQASQPEQLIAREQQIAVRVAIAQMPAREAEALLLLAVEGCNYPEIAQAMGCRESTVRVLVMKARRRLRAFLAKSSINDSKLLKPMEV
jgi:RNA polymerase sigma-70 factor, ECF subfamily